MTSTRSGANNKNGSAVSSTSSSSKSSAESNSKTDNDAFDFAQNIASNIQGFIQSTIKRVLQQETAALRAEIEDLKAHVNALEVELKCVRPNMNGIPPKGELFKANVIKYIKLEDEEDEPSFLTALNNNNYDDEENFEDEEENGQKLDGEDTEEYDPQTYSHNSIQTRKRGKRSTPQSITSATAKAKRWRARVNDVVFDDSKIGSFTYNYNGKHYDLTAMVRSKAPASFTNTSITSAAKDITKYFLSMIIGDAHLHLYTSSSRTRRSYEPIPVELQDKIKELVFSGAIFYSRLDEDELRKCITNAVETAIYDKCSYYRKHPHKRMQTQEE